MPFLTITKTYLNGNTLFQVDLDNICNSISTLLNTTLLDYQNIQTGGIIGSNLANGTITATQLATGSVNTAQIASSAITRALLPAANFQISNSCGSFTTTGTTFSDVTNLSVSLTTFGNPVHLFLIADGSSSGTDTGRVGGSTTNAGTNNATLELCWNKSSSAVAFQEVIFASAAALGATTFSSFISAGAVQYVDQTIAGTYVYKLQARVLGGTNTGFLTNCKLFARELT